MQLAQVNVARLLAPLDAPPSAGFREALAPVNALADAAPGFVWRLQDDAGDATAISFSDDPLVIVNLSVWADLASLHAFTFSGAHLDALRRRRAWFERPAAPHAALWWVPIGHRPSLEEARARLARLAALGPTPEAFTFARPHGPGGAPLRPPGRPSAGPAGPPAPPE